MEVYFANTKEKPNTTKPRPNLKNNGILVILYILLLVLQCNCETILNKSVETTKNDGDKESSQCHSCRNSVNKLENNEINNDEVGDDTSDIVNDIITTVSTLTVEYFKSNKTDEDFEFEIESFLDEALSKDKYEIIDGVEIKSIDESEAKTLTGGESRALFSKYTYEYRLLQKIKDFINTHILSINLPKAAKMFRNRSFGLKKFFLPLLIGAQVFKSILLAMFLPSILGSFGKILGKGISQLSASSSQASYPPVHGEGVEGYDQNKEVIGYETDPSAGLGYPNDGQYDLYDQTADTTNIDMSRFGFGGQKLSYLPTRNGYYRNQIAANNNYKVFQKIPSSSMILSNYDPFYSPLLSRLDGIFARLGLTPSENAIDDGMQVGGQNVNDIKLESCREQLICLMYATPAKYAPYSNLVSAQLSRELNELRRPVSDNPEILRFFRYMRAARRGQEGVDCVRAHPTCSEPAAPTHTMIHAYHDINKLVTARKLKSL